MGDQRRRRLSLLEGIDVVERDDDHRLRRIVMFFGPVPPAAT